MRSGSILLVCLVLVGCSAPNDKAAYDNRPYNAVKASNDRTEGAMREAIRIDRQERTGK